MSSDSYIVTVNGLITINELKSKMQNKQNKSFKYLTTLPYEHLIQNLCVNLIEKPDIIDKKESVSLKNYSKILSNPFSVYQNLYLESDRDKISNYLSIINKNYNCCLISEATTELENEKHINDLKEISKISGMPICTGLQLNPYYIDLNRYIKDIQFNIVYGFENNAYVPSFIGELKPKEFPINKKEEDLYNSVINDLLNKLNIPVIFKLNFVQKNNNTIIPWLLNKKIDNKKNIVFVVDIYDNDNYEKLNILMKNIIENGFSLIIGIYGCDIENNEYNKKNYIDSFCCKDKATFINKFLIENRQYDKQIMISNNINFRIQLNDYGGFGYENIFLNYFNDITKNLNEEEIKNIFCENNLNLLQWWKHTDQFQKEQKYVSCAYCKKKKLENDEDLFSKNGKIFCSFKCLKSYFK